MKILVPCDFSKSSNNAALYAAHFAKHVKADIILYHVVHIETASMVQFFGFIEEKIEEIRISNATEECKQLADELKSKVKGIKISFQVTHGFPIEETIVSYSQKNDIDLIIMGTKGASGVEKIFGSKAVAVINKSSIPVITVPTYCRYNKIKNIVYASDMHKIRSEIGILIPYAELFNASISILHILPPNSKKKLDVKEITDSLIKKYKYQKISFSSIHSSDIVEGIDDFVEDSKADLLAMFTHEIKFLEKLFKTSYSRKEAFHSLVPLLTIKK